MPQLVNKRRSRLAVLVVSALVASMLAITGAVPAAGQSGLEQPDARSTWLACVGAAKGGGGFTDVDMGSPHYDNINCLAYYGISTGKTADTYDPGSHVTRSQMALFLTRAAQVAGIDLGDAMDMGFTDLGMTGADRASAINTLASKGIMAGRTATAFDPGDYVTRADMAQHLFTLLDLELDSVHIDTLPMAVDGDGTGIEVNVMDGDGMRPDDYFGDVQRTQPVHIADMINAIYELGITNGTNNMTGDMGTFEPTQLVTRAQMASFIMRAMGHTNLRPEGLTAQQTSNQTQISVRNADFEPVLDQRVELISTSYPEDAFDRNGGCITTPSYVMGIIGGINTSGFDPCGIDLGDERTDAMGNVVFEVGSRTGSRFSAKCSGTAPATNTGAHEFRFIGTPGAPPTMWAWQGEMGDAVDSRSTELVEPVGANAANPGRATQATIAGGSLYEVKMGRTLTYTVQLRNAIGQPIGPTPGDDNNFDVTVVKTAEAQGVTATGAARAYIREVFRQTTTHTPDRNGLITIVIPNPDPTPFAATPAAANDSDVQVTVSIQRASNNPLPVTSIPSGGTAITTTAAQIGVSGLQEVFSDNPSAEESLSAKSEEWRLRSGVTSRNRNSISVEVFDQYGDPYSTRGNQIEPTDAITVTDFQDSEGTALTYTLPANGRRTITYTHNGAAALAQTVRVGLVVVGQDGSTTAVNNQAGRAITGSVVVFWADGPSTSTPSESTASVAVRVGDPRANYIVIAGGAGGSPLALPYGEDDTFFVEGVEVTLAQFEEVLSSYGTLSSDPIVLNVTTPTEATFGNLEWARFDYNTPRDGATWEISGLSCRVSARTR